jgi:hypothetical protein
VRSNTITSIVCPRNARGLLRSSATLALILLVTLSPCHLVTLSAAPLPIRVPVVGRPEAFSEAVGNKFVVSTRADKTEMYLGQAMVYTVQVRAVGKFWHAPERPDLQEMPKFRERFKIARSSSPQPDRVLDNKAWEFDYRLQPVSESVERIPPLPLAYYHPHPKSDVPGHFFTTFGDEIELKIKPVVSPNAKSAKPIMAPAWLFEPAPAADVLRSSTGFIRPSMSLLALVLLAPPALGFLWYAAWRRLYPDAAGRARIRRSRAALLALQDLSAINGNGSDRVERVTAITGTYLRQRFDLAAVEPTPAEVDALLRRHTTTEKLADSVARFFADCDAARFAPTGSVGQSTDPVEAARQLIVSLEERSCPS